MISFEDTQRTLTKNTAENNITEVNPVQQAEAILDDVRFSDDTLSRRRSNADNDASPSEIQKFPQPNSIPEDIPPVTTPPIEHDAREIFGDPTVIAHSHYTHLNQPEIPEQYVIPNETQTAIKLANEAFASAISMVQININTDSQIPDQDKKRLSAFMRKVSKAILEVPTHYANGDDLKNKEKIDLLQINLPSITDFPSLVAVDRWSSLLNQKINDAQAVSLGSVIPKEQGENVALSPNVKDQAKNNFEILAGMISRSQELMKEKEKEREEATLPESMDFKKAEIATANRVFHDAIVSSLNQIVTQRIFDSGESGIISTIITTLEQTIVDVQRENSHVILTAKESYVYDKLENKFSESHASLLVRAIPILREKLKAYGDNLDEINKQKPMTEKVTHLINENMHLFYMMLDSAQNAYTQAAPHVSAKDAPLERTQYSYTQANSREPTDVPKNGLVDTIIQAVKDPHGAMDGFWGRNADREAGYNMKQVISGLFRRKR